MLIVKCNIIIAVVMRLIDHFIIRNQIIQDTQLARNVFCELRSISWHSSSHLSIRQARKRTKLKKNDYNIAYITGMKINQANQGNERCYLHITE